jgi:pimeloyl-ACP methyl ester carboxylesterase
MDFKTVNVAGLRLFYREAGDASKPTIVLLHRFPAARSETGPGVREGGAMSLT